MQIEPEPGTDTSEGKPEHVRLEIEGDDSWPHQPSGADTPQILRIEFHGPDTFEAQLYEREYKALAKSAGFEFRRVIPEEPNTVEPTHVCGGLSGKGRDFLEVCRAIWFLAKVISALAALLCLLWLGSKIDPFGIR